MNWFSRFFRSKELKEGGVANRSYDHLIDAALLDDYRRNMNKRRKRNTNDLWMDIKTAPKDGTRILGWDVLNKCETIAFYHVHPTDEHFTGWFHVDDWLGGAKLSHWQELPGEPKCQ